MSRRALFYSLVLHAGLLVLVGWRSSSTAAHAGSGDPGVGVSFLAEMPTTPLLVEAAPAAEPQSEPEIPAVEPPVSPSAPAVIEPAAPVAAIPPEASQPALPSVMPARSARKAHSTASSTGNASAARKSGAGTDGSGASLAGSGRGGGGPGYVPPQFRIRYKPPYPEEARAQRLEGLVLLLVQVDADGRVVSAGIRQSCGHTLLDRVALEAVRSWRFYPARQNGAAIAAQVEVPVNFRFEERRTART